MTRGVSSRREGGVRGGEAGGGGGGGSGDSARIDAAFKVDGVWP